MSKNLSIKTLLVSLGFLLCLTMQPAFAANPARPAEPAGTGKITGRLLDRETRKPLAGEVGAAYVVDGRIIFTHATASKDGRFVLDNLGAEEVYLTTKLEGYAVEHRSVSLRPGQTKSVDLSLVRPALLRGTVRNPEGLPVAGATVKVFYPMETPAAGRIRTTYQWETGEALSDAQGGFMLAVHPDRPFVVEASHSDFLTAVSAPREVKVTEKREAVVALTLEKGVTLSGVLRGADGKAIAGAQVRLIEAGARRAIPGFLSHSLLEQQLRIAPSGADGAFRFEKVSPTAKMVVVHHPATSYSGRPSTSPATGSRRPSGSRSNARNRKLALPGPRLRERPARPTARRRCRSRTPARRS